MAKPDPAKLQRLQRLGRVRSIARQDAARQSAEAESALAQLRRLTDRSGILADSYNPAPGSATDAAALGAALAFRSGLITLQARTRADQARAQETADGLQSALALAERRRALVQERVETTAKAIAAERSNRPSGSNRRTGTKLD